MKRDIHKRWLFTPKVAAGLDGLIRISVLLTYFHAGSGRLKKVISENEGTDNGNHYAPIIDRTHQTTTVPHTTGGSMLIDIRNAGPGARGLYRMKHAASA